MSAKLNAGYLHPVLVAPDLGLRVEEDLDDVCFEVSRPWKSSSLKLRSVGDVPPSTRFNALRILGVRWP
jgi:hypothetical protein